MEKIHNQVVAHTNIMLGKFFPHIFGAKVDGHLQE